MSSEKEEQIKKILDECSKNPNLYKNLLTWIFTSDYEKISKNLNLQIDAKTLNENLLSKLKEIPDLMQKDTDQFKLMCYSSIYGAFYGDSRGAYCEFTEPNENNHSRIYQGETIFGTPTGSITDDSEMALSLCYAIMENPALTNIKSAYNYFFYFLWYCSGPSDIGNTVRNALGRFDRFAKEYDMENEESFNKIYKYFKAMNESSKSNGWLMRFSPFITWYAYRKKKFIEENLVKVEEKLYKLYLDIFEEAKKDVVCTHSNFELPGWAAMYTIMGLGGIFGKTPNDVLDYLEILLKNKSFNTKNKENKEHYYCGVLLKEALDEIKAKDFDKKNYFINKRSCYHSMGYFLHAFRLILHFLIHLDEYKKLEKPIESIFDEICDYGGDTDTNGAIVGAIIGPFIGIKNFGQDFGTLIYLNVPKRLIYSSCMAYFFMQFLEETKEKEKNEKFYFLRKILEMMI